MRCSCLVGAGILVGAVAGVAQETPPVLDVHLHALGAADQGPPPLAMCTQGVDLPFWDQQEPWGSVFMRVMKEPDCDAPIWSPETDAGVRDRTLSVMERLNVHGVLSGPTARVREWRDMAPGRFIPGLGFRLSPHAPSPDSLRVLYEAGDLAVLAEITNQYLGIAPGDERMEPFWALAEELGLPVGIHMGPGPPGVAHLGSAYRASLSSPLLLEGVLTRHPGLRLYIMHAGFPFLDDLLAVLYAHPQVYVGVGVIVFSRPPADFYRFLKAVVDAGFEDRIMFGSDQMVWPETIEVGIKRIMDADFLTEAQKRLILYDNAARFLRLSEAERASHWGRD